MEVAWLFKESINEIKLSYDRHYLTRMQFT